MFGDVLVCESRSELERRFKRLAREAGLPNPQTCTVVNGFEVDFYWPEIPLIVETDGFTYHRTPTRQKKDRVRDQAHTAAGIHHLRFTHQQVRDEPTTVRQTLARTAALLAVLVVAIAGCGDSNDEPASSLPRTTPAPDKQHPIDLKLNRDSASAGQRLELTIVNRTKKRFEFGAPYRLEHFVDGEWRWINKDVAFVAILKVLEPREREREQIVLPDQLDPGRYRIVKSFRASPGGRELTRTVEFRVP